MFNPIKWCEYKKFFFCISMTRITSGILRLNWVQFVRWVKHWEKIEYTSRNEHCFHYKLTSCCYDNTKSLNQRNGSRRRAGIIYYIKTHSEQNIEGQDEIFPAIRWECHRRVHMSGMLDLYQNKTRPQPFHFRECLYVASLA